MKAGILVTTGAILILLSGVWSCSSTKKTAASLPEPPNWISERPVRNGFYYGIGSAQKRGSAQIYRQRAAEKALSDIAGQIATHIESQASMYRVEDKFGVRETYDSHIKTQSEDFLEGQEVIDEYQNENLYYVLYRLSADTYQSKRAERKQKALKTAEKHYRSGLRKAQEGDYQLAFHFLLQCIETIYPFKSEKTWIVSENDTIDLFNAPLIKLKSFSEQFSLKASTNKTEVSGNFITGDEMFLSVRDHLNRPVSGVPILFSVEGGYLISNRAKTDSNGNCNGPKINISDNRDRINLNAKIDLAQWVNQGTELIEIRNLVKKWPVASCQVEVGID
jgi:hypothetical protein